jgi:MFS family permease
MPAEGNRRATAAKGGPALGTGSNESPAITAATPAPEAVPSDGVGSSPARERPPSARSGHLAVLLLGWVAGIMSAGVCLSAVSLASATTDLDLSPLMRSACAGAASLAIAATAVAAGVAADRLGRRRILMWSYVLAGLANVAIVLIPSGVVYLAGNFLAGVAYGVMLTATYANVKVVAPAGSLGRALGLWGMYSIVFATVANLAGGMLGGADWRWLFLVVPAMCVLSAILTPRLLPPMPRVGSGPVDVWGLVLIGLGLMIAISGLLAVATDPGSLLAWALVAGGGLVLVAWVTVELRRQAPAFPVRLFRSSPFVAAVLVGIFVNGAYAAPVISLSDYLQYEKQDSVFVATFGLQPFYLIGAVAWFIAGRRLSAGRSPRRVITLSSLIAAAGFVALLPVHQSSAYWVILPGSLLVGYGTNAALTGQAQVFVDAAPADAYGAVTSSRLTIGQLGYSLGMILTTLVLSRLTASGIVHGLTTEGMSSQDAYAALAALNTSLLSGQPPAVKDLSDALRVAASAFDAAFDVRMAIAAVVMVATAAATWLLMRERRPH